MKGVNICTFVYPLGDMKAFIKYIASRIGKRNPELLVRIRYWMRFHKRLDLDNPQTLNEKIQYLSLRTDTSEWTRLSDKYQVREYVRECGLEHILNKLYGVWDSADDIDFSSLPKQFVIKTTHGSGDCVIIKDINNVDINKIRKDVNARLHETYGLSEGGVHYSRIKPRVIVEELLENDAFSAQYSSSLIDYKIWCFNGKACYIWVCTDRTKDGTKVMTYDTDWNAHPEYSVFTAHYMRDNNLIPEPANLKQMLEFAQKLSSPFPVVRVDLYNLEGRIVFGEMTFTSLGGLMDFYTDEFLKMTGDMIHIP